MPRQKQTTDANTDAAALLKKLLVLQLFAMGVPQGVIATKASMSKATVNGFLKGIKKNANKEAEK